RPPTRQAGRDRAPRGARRSRDRPVRGRSRRRSPSNLSSVARALLITVVAALLVVAGCGASKQRAGAPNPKPTQAVLAARKRCLHLVQQQLERLMTREPSTRPSPLYADRSPSPCEKALLGRP